MTVKTKFVYMPLLFSLTLHKLLKHVNLRRIPSLELAFILIFSYAPYGLSEGLKLSGTFTFISLEGSKRTLVYSGSITNLSTSCCLPGIMAILFCGIVMSHYTHFNLSSQTQVTVQQIFRTISFMTGEKIIILFFFFHFSIFHNSFHWWH